MIPSLLISLIVIGSFTVSIFTLACDPKLEIFPAASLTCEARVWSPSLKFVVSSIEKELGLVSNPVTVYVINKLFGFTLVS